VRFFRVLKLRVVKAEPVPQINTTVEMIILEVTGSKTGDVTKNGPTNKGNQSAAMQTQS